MSDDFVRSSPAVTNCFLTGPRSNFTPAVYNSPKNKVARRRRARAPHASELLVRLQRTASATGRLLSSLISGNLAAWVS